MAETARSLTTGRLTIQRWRRGKGGGRIADELAVEEPLEIRLETRSIAVTMRTPGNDEELAAGFLLSESAIRNADDLAVIRPNRRNKDGNSIDVFLRPGLTATMDDLTRHVFASSSCGLCGRTSIESLSARIKKISSGLKVSPGLLLALPPRMREAQETFSRTGGLHGAGLFSENGELLILREDVGRHNAVDKVIGWALLQKLLPLNRHILLISGRASFEIVQKSLIAGIPLVAAVSAPSTLAVALARRYRQTLVGFLRDSSLNVYSQPKRLIRPRNTKRGKHLAARPVSSTL